MELERTIGLDWTLPAAPPLVDPPLSLVGLAPTLVDLEGLTADAEQAAEQMASAEAAQAAAVERLRDATAESRAALEAAIADGQDAATQAASWANDARKRLADLQRWEGGFSYLPELSIDDLEVWVPDSNVDKTGGANQPPFAWYDPFTVIGRDDRSMFGLRQYQDRAQRAVRGLRAHEAWDCEHEFWTGSKIPTNYHLSAGPGSPTSSPHRDIDAWPLPDPAPGTTLGTAVGLDRSLAFLDQAIADSDAGVGMIHASPFLVQMWSSKFPMLRSNDGRILTVNFNVLVPGYGYPGSGPDRGVDDAVTTDTDATLTSSDANFTAADVGAVLVGSGIPDGTTIASVTDEHTIEMSAPATATATGVSVGILAAAQSSATKQWAYATDTVYKLRGDVHTYPWDWRQAAGSVNTHNDVEIRAERSWAFVTNRQLRAAVLVDIAA